MPLPKLLLRKCLTSAHRFYGSLIKATTTSKLITKPYRGPIVSWVVACGEEDLLSKIKTLDSYKSYAHFILKIQCLRTSFIKIVCYQQLRQPIFLHWKVQAAQQLTTTLTVFNRKTLLRWWWREVK